MVFCFFFSSRRRHTRSLCDWSSDVCSSDLDVVSSICARSCLTRAASEAERPAPSTIVVLSLSIVTFLDWPRSSNVRRSEEHTSELQSHSDLVCRLLLEKRQKPRNALKRTAI